MSPVLLPHGWQIWATYPSSIKDAVGNKEDMCQHRADAFGLLTRHTRQTAKHWGLSLTSVLLLLGWHILHDGHDVADKADGCQHRAKALLNLMDHHIILQVVQLISAVKTVQGITRGLSRQS